MVLQAIAASWVGDEEGLVVADEDVLDFLLGLLIDILLVKGDMGLGDSLLDDIDLGGVAAAANENAYVDAVVAVSNEEDGIVGLVAHDLRLHQLDWASVDLDHVCKANKLRECPEASPSEYSSANKELRKIKSSVDLISELRSKQKEINDLKAAMDESLDDKGMFDMANEELRRAIEVENQLLESLLHKDDCILEMRAGGCAVKE